MSFFNNSFLNSTTTFIIFPSENEKKINKREKIIQLQLKEHIRNLG